MILYADILLVLNWWLDFLLLLGVRRTLGLRAAPWRLALGAFAGALSAVVVFLPPLSWWVSLVIKLLSAAVMVLTSFGWQGKRLFTRQLLLLFGFSVGMAGICGALYFFVAPAGLYLFNGVVYYYVPPLLLVVLTAVCYVLLCVAERVMRRRAPQGHSYAVTIFHGGGRVTATCLYDSGNHLTEPFSNRPVLVLERAVASRLLPIPLSVSELPFEGGWRLIPFESVGGKGVLPAFSPDKVVAFTSKSEVVLPLCYVAVCPHLGMGEYQGLISSALGESLT